MDASAALMLQRMLLWSSVPCSCLTIAATRPAEALLAVQALALSSCGVTRMHWPHGMASKSCQHGARHRTSPQVGNLAQHSQAEENVGNFGAGCRVEGVIDKVRHKCCKAPVVSTVLEQVCQWHGAMAEPAQFKQISADSTLSCGKVAVSRCTS